MEIQVKLREVYGKAAYYPACARAKVFCEMMQTKTLTPHMIDCIKKLGYNVTASRETIEL